MLVNCFVVLFVFIFRIFFLCVYCFICVCYCCFVCLCSVFSSQLSWVAGLSILDFPIGFLCSVFCVQFTVVVSRWMVHSWFLYRFSLFCVLCSVHCCLESLDCPFLIPIGFLCSVFCAQFTVVVSRWFVHSCSLQWTEHKIQNNENW
jgi:hypothetical protein